MSPYAARTTVSVEKSKAEIERTLSRYGAEQFMYGWGKEGAVIAFIVQVAPEQRRQVRFTLPLPQRTSEEFTHYKRGYNMVERTQAAAEQLWEQAGRQKWRALALVIKAKLEAIESGIATFEDEFLSYIVLPSGETTGEWLVPQLEDVYGKGQMPAEMRLALPAGSQ